jgi:hypothetical protein
MSANNGSKNGKPRLVRPYAMTGGRTRSRQQFPVEALVSTRNDRRSDTRPTPERRTIVELCREARSIAEIASALHVPLGVARVLVGDMAEEGIVHVHRAGYDSETPDTDLLERVLSGLQRL